MGNRLYIKAVKNAPDKVYIIAASDDYDNSFFEMAADKFEAALKEAEKAENGRAFLKALIPHMGDGFKNLLIECANCGAPTYFECGKSKAGISLEDIEAEMLNTKTREANRKRRDYWNKRHAPPVPKKKAKRKTAKPKKAA